MDPINKQPAQYQAAKKPKDPDEVAEHNIARVDENRDIAEQESEDNDKKARYTDDSDTKGTDYPQPQGKPYS